MQDNKNNNRINLVDLFLYLLSHWYWFVLCTAIAVSYTYYKYAQTPFTYRSDATVIIKDPSSAQTTASMTAYSSQINRVNMTNEILQLRSKQLMSQVVLALDADIDYILPVKLRNVELYTLAPVRMNLIRSDNIPESFQLTVTTLDDNNIRVGLSDGRSATFALGDTVSVYGTQVVFTPTPHFKGEGAGKLITINKRPVANATNIFLSRLKVSQSDGTILQLSMQDYSLRRANDILNTLVEKYNEDAIREKNRIAVNTAQFINERLLIIQQELGSVEDEIARFKTSERIMDVDQATNQYLSENKSYNAEIVKVETQLKLAEYLRDFITNSFQSYEPLPINTGLEDARISNEITQYNNLVLQRERLLEASSAESPAVKQIENTLLPLRQTILGSINNLITSLNVRRNDLGDLERESLRKFTAMPAKARQLLSIERQQSIKESLYLYLLNKREENALTQSMVDNNARMIDTATGSTVPIYPSRNKMLLTAILIGLLIPGAILLARLFIDQKIRTRKDLEDSNCSVPFLAELPKVKMKKPKKGEKQDPKHTAYSNSEHKSFTESMRLMATNLNFMRPEGCDHAVVATTSFNTSAG
ncbi:MAG: chromosome partitioning protein ParA, partial [Bacteroidales bacterium]|nr:chromosome partitioning protein ParA [Bacteroidales bacterium]